MNRLRKLLELPREDRNLLIETALLLGLVRVGLWLLPYPMLHCLLDRRVQPKVDPEAPDPAEVGRIAWAVATASRYVPGASCLTQALAARRLLERLGQPVLLRFGVVKGREGRLQAHAWIENGNHVVIGQSEHLGHLNLLTSPIEDIP
jgi:hypothetical protein